MRVIANRRWVEIGTLSGLTGAGRTAVRTAENRPPATPATLVTVSAASRTASRAASTALPGRETFSLNASYISRHDDGSLRATQTSSGVERPEAVSSSTTWPMSIDATPSTIAWWVLVTSATRPPDRPSTRYISHSGRVWSSGRDMSRATRSHSARSVPGGGSAERRTW